MKRLLALLSGRAALVLAGALALALLVWLGGPLLAIGTVRPLESAGARVALLAGLAALYGARRLWRLLAARRANASLLDALLGRQGAPAAPPAPGAAEVTLLEQRFAQAAAVLKRARLGGGGNWARFTRQWVYELPWYIMLGGPGSGKTTALANSGLPFPLADQMGLGPVGGVGGTRNCDWWFSNEAVLLDTAGRYTTQDSDRAADSAAWGGFLKLLARYRARRPINGVLLTLSVAELLEQDGARRADHLAALRARIDELQGQLAIRFPLYVLVTKTDLLAGFVEYFADMGKEERAQVWGATLPWNGQPGPARPDFTAELAALEQRLNARLLERLEQERDPERRARLYLFPQQFAALRLALQDFLAELFAPSRYAEPVLVRGVYFTSATQEGTPIDRVMARLGRALQLERQVLAPAAGAGKSFFLTRLLQEVVFREAGLAGSNQRAERRRALLHAGLLGGAVLLVCAALGAWAVSYGRNRAYVAAVAQARAAAAQALAAAGAAGTDLPALLPALDAVQHVADVPAGAAGAALGFGLDQRPKLHAAARHAYLGLLRDQFLPRLALRLEQQLREDARANRELLYEDLKAYLMLHEPRHLEPQALGAFFAADWDARLPRSVSPAQRAALAAHLAALLAAGDWGSAGGPADRALVASTRDAIARVPLAERIYQRLQRQQLGAGLPEFTVARAGGPLAPLVFMRASGEPLTRGVPGLYSFDGFHRVFAAAAERVTAQLAGEQDWVLGQDSGALADAAARARLLDQVRTLYLRDYARRWDGYVADIRLVPAASLQQSVELARILSGPTSPLPPLLRAIVHEVTLVPPAAAPPAAGDKLKGAREELLRLFGQAPEQPGAAPPLAQELVDRRFDELRRLVSGNPPPLDATLALLGELYTLLNATEAAVRSGATPPPSEVPNRVRAEAARMPEPVRSLLQALVAGSSSQAMGATRSNLSSALGAAVGDFCQRAIEGRYPFVRASPRDVTPEDFTRLFAAGGLLDEFFQKNLAPFVNTATRPWSFRDLGAGSLAGGAATLLQFQRAQVIRQVFFRAGAAGPSVRLSLKPLELDAAISQFVLDIDGQLVTYSHGPQVPTQVQWPGPRGSGQVRIELSPPAGDGSGQLFEGPWALFRLFDHARVEPGAQPERFVATFDVGGRRARFEVVASSVQNPFRLPELEQFQCPRQL